MFWLWDCGFDGFCCCFDLVSCFACRFTFVCYRLDFFIYGFCDFAGGCVGFVSICFGFVWLFGVLIRCMLTGWFRFWCRFCSEFCGFANFGFVVFGVCLMAFALLLWCFVLVWWVYCGLVLGCCSVTSGLVFCLFCSLYGWIGIMPSRVLVLGF